MCANEEVKEGAVIARTQGEPFSDQRDPFPPLEAYEQCSQNNGC